MVRHLSTAAAIACLVAGLRAGQAPPNQSAAGALSGVILDELKRPVPGLQVTAFRASDSGGARYVKSDDRGEYRFTDLRAGEYVIAVVVSHRTSRMDGMPCSPNIPLRSDPADYDFMQREPVPWVSAVVGPDRLLLASIEPGLAPAPPGPGGVASTYVTTYAPRAVSRDAASRVSLASGQERSGVDIELQLRPSARVAGHIPGWKHLDLELAGPFGTATTSSGVDGSFVFLDVPAGFYTLRSAEEHRDCDVTLKYGAASRGQADLTIEPGETAGLVFTLGPGSTLTRSKTSPASAARSTTDSATIEGVVTTDLGQPLDRVIVSAISSDGLLARTVTASDGRFRIDDLPAGTFTLSVSRHGFRSQVYGQRHPGEERTIIALRQGQRFAAKIVMPRPGVISGVVRDERGAPMSGLHVFGASVGTETDDRGRYRLWPVAPGSYSIGVSSGRNRDRFRGFATTYYPGETEAGQARRVSVEPGSRIDDVDVALRRVPVAPVENPAARPVPIPSFSIPVRTTFDGTAPRHPNGGFSWELVHVTEGESWRSAGYGGSSYASLDSNGRGVLPDVRTGRYVLKVETHDQWVARSALVGAVDGLDLPFSVGASGLPEVVVTFTDRPTSLTGTVHEPGGSPTAEATVIVFSADARFWTPQSRRIRVLRPRSDGQYRVSRLPAGAYAIVAVPQIAPGQVVDPAFLGSLLPGAVRTTLSEGQEQVVTIRVSSVRR